MWAETLPTELLIYIFKYLNARDLMSCSEVCHRWREAFECLPDGYWRQFCDQNYWCTRTTAEKKSLPKNFNSLCPLYRDLYNSLCQWPEIETAAINYMNCPFKYISTYKILNNTTLAILPECYNGLSAVIVYYDLETFEEKGRQSFEFPFHKYDENDIMITVVNATSGKQSWRRNDGKLYVMPKETKKSILIGTLFGSQIYSEYKLFEDKVFFMNEKHDLSVATLKNCCGSITVETTMVVDGDICMPYEIVAFSFTDVINFIHINGFINKNTSLIDRLNFGVDLVEELAHYGFDWSYPTLYNWLKDYLLPQPSIHITRITEIDAKYICRHGHIVVLGTEHEINIYVNPYDQDGKLTLYGRKPDRSICIRRWFDVPNYRIRKIDVIEIMNGHRILILFGHELRQINLVKEDFMICMHN